ncbi:Cemip [Symbiodinium natans]|uniref:Cemip protein n=1 Tax=Symbiodinium natans TaxID=878477 RepID=A0A812RKZ6_9DINO|nr:Cemip [Symbiodinium natans]
MPIKLLAATLSACCVAIPVTFKVQEFSNLRMSGYTDTVFADFRGRPVAPGGPHLAGSFQGWDPTATALADADADGIYAITLDLPAASYEFKFINGSSMEDAEALPPRCSVGGDEESYFYGYGNWNAHRIIHIAENATSAEVHFCFQECQPCDALALCIWVLTLADFHL